MLPCPTYFRRRGHRSAMSLVGSHFWHVRSEQIIGTAVTDIAVRLVGDPIRRIDVDIISAHIAVGVITSGTAGGDGGESRRGRGTHG